MKRILIILLAFVLLMGYATSCFAISRGKINALKPDMTTNEVEQLLGKPYSTQLTSDKLVWKYFVFQFFVGSIPYYLAFNKDTLKLESWYEDQNEYKRNQQATMNVVQQISSVNLQRQPKQVQLQAQRQQLQSDYNAGKLKSAEYYSALANIDRVEIEYKKEQRQQRQIIPMSNARTSTVRDRSGNVIGHVTEDKPSSYFVGHKP